nr:E2 [Firstpapillomavirinae PV-HMU-2]
METMDALCSHLDVLQEKQMDLCERDTGTLTDAILYWQLMRRECMLLCAARRRGVNKIGILPVPSLQACEAQAKEAIRMHLVVASLLGSVYADEQWSLTCTSKGMYNTPPKDTFKKGGETVTVTFDGDAENCMEYTAWKHIYTNVTGEWEVVAGNVSHDGLYYTCGGVDVYYVRFQEEARVYGTTGTWDVRVGDTLVTQCSLHSSPEQTQKPHVQGPGEIPIVAPAAGVPENTETDTGAPPPKKPRSGCLAARRKHCARLPLQQQVGCNGGSVPHTGSRGNDRATFPVVIIGGSANQVKCLRHRIRTCARGLYTFCSTSWAWVDPGGHKHCGHRIIVAFDSYNKRAEFLDSVPVPDSMFKTVGDLPRIVLPSA